MHESSDGPRNEGTAENSEAEHTENSDNAGTGSAHNDKRSYRILYLFSGPRRPTDGLEKFLHDEGVACECVDIEYDTSHDLRDNDFWSSIKSRLDEFDGFMLSPPCGTFTAARNDLDGGPPPLRGITGNEVYGLPGLEGRDLEKVKEGNLFAFRCLEVMEHAEHHHKPWILEQPSQRDERTSMFNLPEMKAFKDNYNSAIARFAQCTVQSQFEKLTDLWHGRVELMDFTWRCAHDKVWWRIPWSGEPIYAAHPPLRGRQMAIPAAEWRPHMRRQHEPSGDYITRSAAAYPGEMNRLLAVALAKAIKSSGTRHGMQGDQNDQGDVNLVDPKMVISLGLRGTKISERVELSDANSLRNVHKSLTSRSTLVGTQVANLISRYLDSSPHVEDKLLSMVGAKLEDCDLPTEWIDELRVAVKELLIRNRQAGMASECDIEPINESGYNTVVRGHLLHYWAQVVGDPAVCAAEWTFKGAPAGLECDTSCLDGLCPSVVKDEEVDECTFSDLATDYSSFENYTGVEESVDAVNAVKGYFLKGYLEKFATLEEVSAFVGGKPILSKLGCIKRDKVNPETLEVTTKTRIILDCKQSQVSKVASRTHKSVLPRVTDAVGSALSMLASCNYGESVTMFILDIVDAFWLVPLAVRERKYFVAKLQGEFYVFLRTAQGSRAAPLTFAVLMGLASRWVQSVAACCEVRKRASEKARLQVYVDDPLVLLRGSPEVQRRLCTLVILSWLLMGFPVAFHKAVLSPTLVWVGIKLRITDAQVCAEVLEEKVRELKALLLESISGNVLSKKKLRTLIGKCMAVASVIYVWRPFIQEMYGALHACVTRAPQGCVWSSQIKHSVQWLLKFLQQETSCIQRVYSLNHFLRTGPNVVITWDASPFGMGATLQIQGKFVEYFSIPISCDDTEILETKSGGCDGQQVWEALTGLIALRQWATHWLGQRATLLVRADNTSALILFSTLRARTKALTIIAREFALDLGRAEFRPDMYEHVPGITDIVCDMLSRQFDPSKTFVLPSALASAQAVTPPERPLSWWRSISIDGASPASPCGADGGSSSRKRKA